MFLSHLRAALEGKEPQFRTPESLVQSLANRKVTVRLGTTAETWVTQTFDELGVDAEVNPVGHHSDGLQAIAAGNSDVLFGDRPILLDEAKRSPRGKELRVLGRYFTYEVISFALSRGDEDFRLLVDRTLSRLYRSGEINDLYASYFGEPGEAALTLFSRASLPD